jgi:hypothetical protein
MTSDNAARDLDALVDAIGNIAPAISPTLRDLIAARVAAARAEALQDVMVTLRDTPEADVEVALGGIDWVLGWLREQAEECSIRPGDPEGDHA